MVALEQRVRARGARPAFVLENSPIDDERALQSFLVPLDHVERHAGLFLFPRLERTQAVPLCVQTSCQLPAPDFYKKASKTRG